MDLEKPKKPLVPKPPRKEVGPSSPKPSAKPLDQDQQLEGKIEKDKTGLEFNVMPELSGTASTHKAKSEILPGKGVTADLPSGNAKKKILIIVIAVVVLAAIGFWVYTKFFQSTEIEENNLLFQEDAPVTPEVILNVNTDLDDDGLSDEDEIFFGTSSSIADTDGDGLADGDEVNIFQTDPLLTDTDNDSFNDGQEVAGGFSPIENSSEPAGEEELLTWQILIDELGIHEPSMTTTSLAPTVEEIESGESEVPEPIIYKNLSFGYQFILPDSLESRESEGQQQVGLYVANTTPADNNISSDPITIAIAVKVGEQDLLAWVNDQHPASTYEGLGQISFDTDPGIKITGLDQGSTCPVNKSFFEKDNTIVILTLTCNDAVEFSELYEGILNSFEFI